MTNATATNGLRDRLSKPVLRTQTDERLVALVRQGSDSAFEVIVERYREPLMRYCGRFLDPMRSEDVVQVTFTKALEFIRGDDRDLALKAWLYRVVHNTALKTLRATRDRDHELSEELAGSEAMGSVVESRDMLRRMVEQVGTLSESERRALVMRAFEGGSYEEIAIALQSTPNGARQMIHRVRTKLRKAVAVLIPLPLLRWAGGISGGSAPAAAGAGVGATATTKLAAALVATCAVAGGVGIVATKSGEHHQRSQGKSVTETASKASSPTNTPSTVAASLRKAISKQTSRSGTTGSVPAAGDTGSNGSAGNSGDSLGLQPHEDQSSDDLQGSSSGASDSPGRSQPTSTGSGSGNKGSGSSGSTGTTGGGGNPGSGDTASGGATTGTPSTVRLSGATMNVVASGGDSNTLRVFRSGSRFVVQDSAGPGVNPTGACAAISATQVGCPAASVGQISVAAGRGDDNVTVDASVGVPVTLDGSYGSDTLVSDSGAAATINGGEAADVLRGGPGNDTITGSYGNDRIDGRGGSDTITGDQNDDTLCGSDGGDSVTGGAGADRVDGGAGANSLGGGAGSDLLYGTAAGNALLDKFEGTGSGTLSC